MLIKIWKKERFFMIQKRPQQVQGRVLLTVGWGSAHSSAAVAPETLTGRTSRSRDLLLLWTHSVSSHNNKESCGCRSRQPVRVFPSTFPTCPWCTVTGEVRHVMSICFFKTVWSLRRWRLEGWEVVALRTDFCFLPSLTSSWTSRAVRKRSS